MSIKFLTVKKIIFASAAVVMAVSGVAAWTFFFRDNHEPRVQWERITLTNVDVALFQAVRDNNMEGILNSLREGGRIDAVNERGVTPFRVAIALNRLNVILEFTRDGRWCSDSLNSYLIFSIIQNRPQIVRELAALSPNINELDKNGYTPLLYAINRSHLAVVTELLNAGADVNARGRDGITPLIAAVMRGESSMVETLLKAGADITASLPSGETAMSIARGNIRREVIASLLAEAEAPENTMTLEEYLDFGPRV